MAVSYGFRVGSLIYIVSAVVMRCLPANIRMPYIYKIFFVRFVSFPLYEWILCDGPADAEASIPDSKIWLMICVIGTHAILYSLPLVPSMVSFAVWILLDIGSLLLKISPVLVVFSVAFYFLGRTRRQLLFEAFRKVGTFLPYWIFWVPLKYSAWGMRSHILGDPSGHWWHRP
jgi:hypothetical protein